MDKLKISAAVLIIVLASSLYAFEMRTGSKVFQSYDMDTDLAVMAGDITVNSNIRGNLYLMGGHILFNGRVDKDLYLMGGDCNVNGTVEENVYIAGGNINVSGQYFNDVNIAGGKIVIDSLSYIRGNLNVAGNDISINGKISGDVEIHADEVKIKGVIDGDLTTFVKDLDISEMALITGFINENEPDNNSFYWHKKKMSRRITKPFIFKPFAVSLNFFLFSLISAAIWYSLFPASYKGSGKLVKKDPVKMGLWGLLCLIVLPLAGILSMIFIVSIPLSIFFLMFIGATVFLGQFPLAFAVGELFAQNIPGFNKGMLPSAAGLMLLHVLIKIPILNVLITVAWILCGFGSIWYWMLKRSKTNATVVAI
jgi:hypothetical protein